MISQTAEYALRAVVFLASGDTMRVSRSEIGEATLVPQDYLTKVLRELDRAGLVKSQRGPGGGYTLSKSSEKMTVYEVVEAVSSVPRIESCPLGIAEHVHLCPLHRRLDDAAEAVEKAFRGTMISELVPSKAKSRQCNFPAAE